MTPTEKRFEVPIPTAARRRARHLAMTVLPFIAARFVLATNPAVEAQNLVVNPDLTIGLGGWTTSNASGPGVTGSTAWDSDSGSSTNGSARLTLSEAGSGSGGTAQTLFQCISALPALPWDFGVRRFVASDSDGIGNSALASAQFVAFANIGCSGSSSTIGVLDSPGSVIPGQVDGAAQSWGQLSGTVAGDPMPGGSATASVRIGLAVQTTSTGDSINALFDSVFFGADGTTPVDLLDFGIEP